ncbi:bacteriocin-like peptide [Shewanella oneidensis]|uniref:Bacteriocin n=1 Tax=Shewanella oneidensis (strain ATCC 700550 / JCM 31522 / CIP 106686 / LMG 19005 / NCIMB 14063 / MR-1) TaxID=211586 RepID=Q0KHM7_SHEON|nr:bacteriocin-like peptide [Shewanella oneidensis]ABI26432.1 bacteriocin [Shewanella oneidensis MR-1]MDX5999769.1 bacteriocin-like peptide [Shewanella oneidensis]MEE2030022.1 hypothetical protein [Shewanella oneidensis]
MQELTMNEIEQVNGSSAACVALTGSTTIMGGAIGVIAGGIVGPGGMATGGFWGAQFGQSIGLALCSQLR